MTESALQKAAIDLLVMYGWLVIRINSGAMQVDYTDKRAHTKQRYFWFSKWYAGGHGEETSGVSDLVAVSPGGETIFIEMKKPGGSPTAHQTAFGREVQARGGRWIVADDIEVIRNLVEES